MPISPDLQRYLELRRAQREQERENHFLGKIPHLAIPDETTLDALSGPSRWHDIDTALKQSGLSDRERQLVHHILTDVGDIKIPIGITHHLTVGEIREMSNEDLLLLQEAHATAADVLRALFGKREEPPATIPEQEIPAASPT